jgi:hypothetical protein
MGTRSKERDEKIEIMVQYQWEGEKGGGERRREVDEMQQ